MVKGIDVFVCFFIFWVVIIWLIYNIGIFGEDEVCFDEGFLEMFFYGFDIVSGLEFEVVVVFFEIGEFEGDRVGSIFWRVYGMFGFGFDRCWRRSWFWCWGWCGGCGVGCFFEFEFFWDFWFSF